MLRKCKGKYWRKEQNGYFEFELGYFHDWINNGMNAIVELQDGTIVIVFYEHIQFLDTKEYCEPILYISKENNKCNHKNLENIDGFIYCKNCGKIISIYINKGE